jgi:regulator of replication initiation timing
VEDFSKMSKQTVYQQELEKLNEIFKDIEESNRKLVEGLIEDAAFLKAENYELKEILNKTGMIKVHPEYPDLQKPTEAAKQYLKNINCYAVVIKALNSVLNKNVVEEDDDELSDYE